jgi:hypothetical protein
MFHIRVKSALAQKFHFQQVLEKMHYQLGHTLVTNHAVLANLKKGQRERVLHIFKETILRTGIESHRDLKDNVQTFLRKTTAKHQEAAELFEHLSNQERTSLCCFLLHAADLWYHTKSWVVSNKWVNFAMEEMYAQAEAERLEVLPVSRNMDKSRTLTAEVQVGYIDWIVFPVVGLLQVLMPEMPNVCIERLRQNRETWQEQIHDERDRRRNAEKDLQRSGSRMGLFGNGRKETGKGLRDSMPEQRTLKKQHSKNNLRKSLFRKSMGAVSDRNAVMPAEEAFAAARSEAAKFSSAKSSSAKTSSAKPSSPEQKNRNLHDPNSDYVSQRNMRLSPRLETAFQQAVEEVESKGAYDGSTDERGSKQKMSVAGRASRRMSSLRTSATGSADKQRIRTTSKEDFGADNRGVGMTVVQGWDDGDAAESGGKGGVRGGKGEVISQKHRRKTLEMGRESIPRHVTGPIGESLTVDTLTKQDELDLCRVEAERTDREGRLNRAGTSGVGNVNQIRKQLSSMGLANSTASRELAAGSGPLQRSPLSGQRDRNRRRSSVEHLRRTLLGAARIGVQAANLPIDALRELTRQIQAKKDHDRDHEGRRGRLASFDAVRRCGYICALIRVLWQGFFRPPPSNALLPLSYALLSLSRYTFVLLLRTIKVATRSHHLLSPLALCLSLPCMRACRMVDMARSKAECGPWPIWCGAAVTAARDS